MNVILRQFENDFNTNINLIKKEYNEFILQINELREKNDTLKQENEILTNNIIELNKEKNAKTSSTIWMTMNSKLSEKDAIIEQLKKDIEFYKRTGPKINIAEKWQSNISNSCDSIETQKNKLPLYNKLIEKQNIIKVDYVVENTNNKNENKAVNENEDENNKDEQENYEDEQENNIVKKNKKHKSKEKSIDKSEKKKKKNKKVIEIENENE